MAVRTLAFASLPPLSFVAGDLDASGGIGVVDIMRVAAEWGQVCS